MLPASKGGSTVKLNLDLLARSGIDRLRRFDSLDACGRWNMVLTDDVRADPELARSVEDVLRSIVYNHSKGRSVASDGLSIENVSIELHKMFRVRFRMHYLDSPSGYGEVPAELIVARSLDVPTQINTTMNCGLREPEGKFWYPANSRIAINIPDNYRWAYCQTSKYGRETLATWSKKLYRDGGEDFTDYLTPMKDE